MGRRLLLFDSSVLLSFLKTGGERHRWLEVGNPLPDDAEIVAWEMPQGGYEKYAALVVRSDEWLGDSREPLEPPTYTIHYAESVELEGAVR